MYRCNHLLSHDTKETHCKLIPIFFSLSHSLFTIIQISNNPKWLTPITAAIGERTGTPALQTDTAALLSFSSLSIQSSTSSVLPFTTTKTKPLSVVLIRFSSTVVVKVFTLLNLSPSITLCLRKITSPLVNPSSGTITNASIS